MYLGTLEARLTKISIYENEVLIFFFHSKKTAVEAHRELQKVYGDAALSETMCRDWFHRFKDGDFDVDDRRVKEV